MLIFFRVTLPRNAHISAEFCKEASITNKLPWDPAAQLLRNREESLQSCLLAQHSSERSQILSKQILTIILSLLHIQMQKKKPLIDNAIVQTSFYSPYKKSSLWHETL